MPGIQIVAEICRVDLSDRCLVLGAPGSEIAQLRITWCKEAVRARSYPLVLLQGAEAACQIVGQGFRWFQRKLLEPMHGHRKAGAQATRTQMPIQGLYSSAQTVQRGLSFRAPGLKCGLKALGSQPHEMGPIQVLPKLDIYRSSPFLYPRSIPCQMSAHLRHPDLAPYRSSPVYPNGSSAAAKMGLLSLVHIHPALLSLFPEQLHPAPSC